MKSLEKITTGLKSFDEVCDGLRMGDNVVWQVDSLYDYERFVLPFAAAAMGEKRRLVYIRFAGHDPILSPHQCSVQYDLDPEEGFENFSSKLHGIITEEGREVFYVFDCLSDLQPAWATDIMVGNFFSVTCPYLYILDTIAYFALLRNSHSFKTIARIRDTTQLLIDVYNSEESTYIHPLKVLDRYSPTMFFPHLKKGETFTPVIDSVEATQLIRHIQKRGMESTLRILDHWDRTFLKAEDMAPGGGSREDRAAMVKQLCRMIMGRDEKILALAETYMDLEDFLELKDHLIGTGFIGGKSTGMLLARKVLSKKNGEKWDRIQEAHDSFYVGSDVFYTYIVQNGWWDLFMEHKTDEGYFNAAEKLRELIPGGRLPDEIKEKFRQIIEYFGQSSIIVRSSSLLEDAYGNAFAGKYESIFLVNQGTPEERFSAFTKAVKAIFSSVMGPDALAYRASMGLQEMDEQMALLVMRVSGSYHGEYFYPDMAGVGLSYNQYVWNESMDPAAGMLRHVVGLGTRAVNRVEGDYPRIIALDNPLLKPYAGIQDARKFSQRQFDALNTARNEQETIGVAEYFKGNRRVNLSFIGQRDTETEQMMRERGAGDAESWLVDFDEFLQKTSFVRDMKMILGVLEEVYQNPVDIEYTLNFTDAGAYRINLLQCRPQQVKWYNEPVAIPRDVPVERVLFRSSGNFVGGNIVLDLTRIIYVDPEGYDGLPVSDKHAVARLVGRVNRTIGDRGGDPVMLIGPGRWGTTTPSLGVPVNYSEIHRVSVIVEIARMRDGLVPEISYGTHFFQDLVESDTGYLAIEPDREGVVFNPALLSGFPDTAPELMPEEERFHGILRVYDTASALRLIADVSGQELVCYIHGE